MGDTLFARIWDAHVVKELAAGWSLLHVDRHLLHDLSGGPALADVAARGLPVHDPALVAATPDHAVSSQPGRDGTTYVPGAKLWAALRDRAAAANVRLYDVGQPGQGIVHVMGPELGIVLPGLTVVCGDSHTCTNGGVGALAFGVGSSESAHALATQALRLQRPKTMRIRCDGELAAGVTAKDLALHLIGTLGAAAGSGYAIEYAGDAIDALEVEARLTLCNLTVELGARFGLIAPDEKTIDWLRGRPQAPKGPAFEQAAAYWRTLHSDDDAIFDREAVIDASAVGPTITWGTSPEHAIAIDGRIPDPATAANAEEREAWRAALDYIGLEGGAALAGTPIDWVFIGSCANSRLSDLRAAAAVVRGRQVAANVTAWVVPGSENVKRAAEAEGLDAVFEAAGFAWREPGCSMCVAANGEQVPPEARCVSTSNRNFVGRQGPRARTHLASPAMAAAAALAGRITDVRTLAAAFMSMQPFTVVSGAAAPFLRANVDTDVIVRIERLTSLPREALGRYAFEAVRFRDDGSEDPGCVFNQPAFRGAPFLLAGPNFGCGSSREGAVWALQALGVRAVVAPSFGDIFYANCFQNGVLPIRLALEQVETLAAQCADGAAITVDLERETIVAPDRSTRTFSVDPLRREALLHGLDDIGLTLKDDVLIRSWQAQDRQRRPWAWPQSLTTA